MSVNKRATQNVWQHHFPEPCGGKGLLWDKLPTDVVEMATLFEFDENDRFFTTFCDPYMGHTFRLFYTFHPKKDTKSGF
jgi:hypothetical protein